jgi:hypothetical protein
MDVSAIAEGAGALGTLALAVVTWRLAGFARDVSVAAAALAKEAQRDRELRSRPVLHITAER